MGLAAYGYKQDWPISLSLTKNAWTDTPPPPTIFFGRNRLISKSSYKNGGINECIDNLLVFACDDLTNGHQGNKCMDLT